MCARVCVQCGVCTVCMCETALPSSQIPQPDNFKVPDFDAWLCPVACSLSKKLYLHPVSKSKELIRQLDFK